MHWCTYGNWIELGNLSFVHVACKLWAEVVAVGDGNLYSGCRVPRLLTVVLWTQVIQHNVSQQHYYTQLKIMLQNEVYYD